MASINRSSFLFHNISNISIYLIACMHMRGEHTELKHWTFFFPFSSSEAFSICQLHVLVFWPTICQCWFTLAAPISVLSEKALKPSREQPRSKTPGWWVTNVNRGFTQTMRTTRRGKCFCIAEGWTRLIVMSCDRGGGGKDFYRFLPVVSILNGWGYFMLLDIELLFLMGWSMHFLLLISVQVMLIWLIL